MKLLISCTLITALHGCACDPYLYYQEYQDDYDHELFCTSEFDKLTAEQIQSFELCSTDQECYDMATAYGIPEQCTQ